MQALAEQNEKLKEALMKLRDLSVGEKQEREKRIKELERENKRLSHAQGWKSFILTQTNYKNWKNNLLSHKNKLKS